MSRVGKQPIIIPDNVTVEINDNRIFIKGPKGELTRDIHPKIKVKREDNKIIVERASDDKFCKSLHGLTRTLINNMVIGVTQGYEKTLRVVGMGYGAQLTGNKLILKVGFSHPVEFIPPKGINLIVDKIEKDSIIKVQGIDKELVGNIAAKIRAIKKPEPYKGKGIRYIDEYVRRKAGKAAKAK